MAAKSSAKDQKSDAKKVAELDPTKQHVLAAERSYRRGQMDGKQITYHKDGRKQMEITLVNGSREGPYVEWYDNGQVRSEGKFYKDQNDGEVSYWYDDGRPWAVYNYFRGRPTGRWLQWDRDGHIVTDQRY